MSQHVIVGAGAVGSATALLLAERGEHVRLVTRRGSGPEHPAIERVAADATDAERLTALTTGAVALYNCANPQYHQWLTDWPPLAAALLAAAERTGAVLVSMSNLYGYGPVDGPITQKTPLAATHPKLRLRAEMWHDALAAHEAGQIRTTEVRASDYIEANGLLRDGLGKPLLAGKRALLARTAGRAAQLDLDPRLRRRRSSRSRRRARLRAGVAGPDEPGADRARSWRAKFAEVNGAPAAKVSAIPYPVLWAYGLFAPMVKELRTTRYQFTGPFVLDSSATTEMFGLEPRPWTRRSGTPPGACAADFRRPGVLSRVAGSALLLGRLDIQALLARAERSENDAADVLGRVRRRSGPLTLAGQEAAAAEFGGSDERDDQTDRNAVGCQFLPDHRGELVNRRLRGCIGADAGPGHPGGARADVDDPAGVPGAHGRKHCLHHGRDTDNVHLQHPRELVQVEDVERLMQGHPGVVDQAVHPAVAIQGQIDQPGDVGPVGHVGTDGEGTAQFAAELADAVRSPGCEHQERRPPDKAASRWPRRCRRRHRSRRRRSRSGP